MFMMKKHLLIGFRTKKTFCLGESLKIKIKSIDLEKRHIDFLKCSSFYSITNFLLCSSFFL